jgi:protocatechuate 3,4-dioxygenase beta subunit
LRRRARAGIGLLAAALLTLPAFAQAPRKIGELQLSLVGLTARLDPPNPAVPKNTAAGVRVVVEAGGRALDAAEVAAFLDSGFEVQAELSGPGLSSTLTLPGPEAPATGDPLILPLPALALGGDYSLSNLRIVAGGRPVVDVQPSSTTLKVIDQILVTSVKTRALTLDEIRAKGIVLDSDDYLGFQFDLGMRVESNPIQLSFPVVFDRAGVPVPAPLLPPPAPSRAGIDVPPMTIVPGLLRPPKLPGLPEAPEIRMPGGQPVRIPSVLVIPGNVGYLKQFFSAKLFVANGAPVGSGLVVRDVTGSIVLPPGEDLERGTPDDPLALPETVRGPQPETMPVLHVGADGEPDTGDDVAALRPAEQGQAEFLVRGEREGFHRLEFDIAATLDGLATGPITVGGRASGGVLVRNPYFDVTFVVPSVVRAGEEFDLHATVTNIGQGAANLLTLALDEAALSGATLLAAPDPIETLAPGDSHTARFRLRSQRTGQVTATYLRFDTASGASGDLRFRLGVGERGVPLSPDTLVLPAAVDALPGDVVSAAMRVLGQAWSAANAPAGLLPRGVVRPRREAVVQRALALAETGLRVSLGQSEADALRDLAGDLASGEPRDAGFDQVLATTEAGRGLGVALRAELATALGSDPAGWIADAEEVLASGPDFASIALDGPVTASWTTTAGERVGLAVGEWLLAPPGAAATTLKLEATGPGPLRVSVVQPRGDGRFARASVALDVQAGGRGTLVIDPARPEDAELLWDAEGDGIEETRRAASTSTFASSGPLPIAAHVIGPETLAGASPFGTQAVVVLDRPVSAAAAADVERYAIARNRVLAARRQLSGRLVFLGLEQPEGPHVPAHLAIDGLPDPRGAAGPHVGLPLGSRLADPGAVVTGRVLEADGAPVPAARVTLVAQTNTLCDTPRHTGVAATSTDAEGRYQFRFVRQDNCGYPFGVDVRDPATGSLRNASAHVRADGEAIALDLVLLGTGAVTGVVRDLTGAAVPGARVVVHSQTDPQVGQVTTSDGDGRYAVSGITVGAVTVQAAKGFGLGHSAGQVARAGETASIDVTIDGGTVRARGRVWRLEAGVTSPAVGAAVWYQLDQGGTLVTVGATTTDADGAFSLEALPTGAFVLRAFLNARDLARATGVAGAGDVVDVDLVVEVDPPDQTATVRGTVRLPDGQPAPGAIVQQLNTSFGALADAEGRYEIRGVPVRPTAYETFEATSADFARKGLASRTVAAAGVVDGVDIQLSGLGQAAFTVLDATGAPVAGQQVSLLAGVCGVARQGTTDAQGLVEFPDVALGSARAAAVRSLPGFTDFASATAAVTREGETGFGILRFGGAAAVTGVVVDGSGAAVAGARVSLTSRVYDAADCGFASRESHLATSDAQGRFRFSAVNVGTITVVARDPWSEIAATARATLGTAGVELTLRLVDTTAGVLSGQVLRPDGATAAGAGVEVSVDGPLPDVLVKTDAAGQFRFARVLPAGRYRLTARDPATGELAREEVYLRAGLDAEHDVVLRGTGEVRVRVVGGDDLPVERAFVRLTETEYPGSVHERSLEPASEGIARFEGVYQGPLVVSVRDPLARGGRASATLARAGDVLEVKVRLTTTGTVQGTFRMPSGEPIAFGTVRLIGPSGPLGQQTTEGAGDVGRFRFEYVPAGSFRLEAQDPLTARTGVAAGSLETEGEVVEVDVRAEGLGRVSGVVTSNGVPEPGARVTVASGRFRASTLADADGLYLVEGVPAGRVTGSASLASGFLKGVAEATLVGDGGSLDLPIALRDSGRVVGRVVASDGLSDGPPSQVSLWVGGSGGGAQSRSSDASGGFEFAQVPEGSASLSADVLGSLDRGRASAEVVGGETTEVAIPLNGLGAIEGTALDSGGAPTSGRLTLSGTGPFGWSHTLSLPPDGRFRLPEVLAGPFTARLAVPSGSLTLYGSLAETVAPGETRVIAIQVQPSGVVRGRVVRSDGATPAYGARVEAALGGNRRVTTQVQSDGAFELPGLPLGPFGLAVSDPLTAGLAVVGGLSLAVNGETLDVGTLVLDHAAPAIQILDPAMGAVRKPLIGTITVSVADDGVGLDPASIQVEYKGGARQAFPAPVEGVTTRALDTGRLVIGSNRLLVHARDLAGNAGRAEVVFTITGSTLRGVLRNADGTLAAGIPVSVSGRAPRVTDAEGRFEEPGLRPGSHTVAATDPVSGLTATAFVSLIDGEDRDMTLSLPAFAHVGGVVTHSSGARAAGVTVLATLQGMSQPTASATTDAAGAWELRNLPLGNWTLDAHLGADRARASAGLAVLGARQEVNLTLNGVGSVTVEVRDALGALVPGAAVTLTSSSPFASARFGTTDTSGRARFESVLAGALTATAHDPVRGLDGSATGGLSDGGEVTLAVELEPVARIVGVVRGALGGVVAGATVELSGPRTATTTSGPDGAFAFEDVPLGAFELEAWTSDGDQGSAAGTLTIPGQTLARDVTLRGFGAVSVLVLDASGAPRPGAVVTLNNAGPARTATTPGDGRVEFSDVPAGTLQARAAWDDLHVARSATLAAGQALDLTLTLQARGTFTGRVLDTDGVTPFAGAAVTLYGSGGVSTPATSDESGRFAFEDHLLGNYSIEVRVAGRLRARSSGLSLTANGQIVHRELSLVPVGSVRGVARVSGVASEGVTVTLNSAHPQVAQSMKVTTGADGAYVFAGVPVGGFTLGGYGSGGRWGSAAGSVEHEGQDVELDLELLASTVNLSTYRWNDGNGFNYQVQPDGRLNPYCTSVATRLTLERDGVTATFAGSGSTVATEEAWREAVLLQSGLAGLDVERRVYIPLDGYFVRHLNVLANPGLEPVTVAVTLNFASAEKPYVGASSSGDTVADAGDRWLLLRRVPQGNNPCGYRSMGFVFGGEQATRTPASVSWAQDSSQSNALVRFEGVTIPPGGRVALMTVVTPHFDDSHAVGSAERLVQLPPELLVGLTPEEAASIVNFAVDPGLRSSLEALPLRGAIAGRVFAGDGETPLTGVSVSYASDSPHYGRGFSASNRSDAAYSFAHTALADGDVIPRTSFRLGATESSPFGTFTASGTGDFAREGVRDITRLPGGTVRVSHSNGPTGGVCCGPDYLTDGNPETRWVSAVPTPRWLEATFPGPATVHELVFTFARGVSGATASFGAGVRLDFHDVSGALIASREHGPLTEPTRLSIPVEPPVAGVYRVRATDLAVAGSRAFGEFQIFGEAEGVSGRADVDLVFRGTGVLRGTVRAADGTPISGVTVKLTRGTATWSLTTAANGSFRFMPLPPGTVTLTATSEQGFAQVVEALDIPADGRLDHDVAFPQLAKVTGTVRTAAGAPLHALVVLSRPGYGLQVGSDAQSGAFEFDDIPDGGYSLKVTDPRSGAELVRPIVVEGAASRAEDFTLIPVGRVRATVRVAGAPLAGSLVSATSDAPGADAKYCTTAATGICEISNVAGTGVQVRARHPDSALSFATQEVRIESEGVTAAATLDVPGVGTLTGTLRARDGVALGSQSAVLSVRTASGSVARSGISTNASGLYTAADLPVGPLRLRFTSGKAKAEVEALLPTADATANVDALAPRGALIAGQRDLWQLDLPAGKVASVRVDGLAYGPNAAHVAPRVEVYDPAGAPLGEPAAALAFTAEMGGRYSVVVRSADPELVGGYQLSSNLDDDDHVYRLPTAPYVAGAVRDEFGAPQGGMRVAVVRDGAERFAVDTDSLGRYVLPLFEAGPVTLVLSDEASLGSVDLVAPETGALEHDFTVPARDAVVIQVRRGGNPAADVPVTLTSDHPSASAEDGRRELATDGAGRIEATLPVGTIRAEARDPRTGDVHPVEGTLRVGEPLELAIDLPGDGATLSGTVRDRRDGRPLAGAWVELLLEDDVVGELRTGSDGQFRFAMLPPGVYQLGAYFGPMGEAVEVEIADADVVRDLDFLEGLPAEGLVLWLAADGGIEFDGDEVVRWTDDSGLGNDAVSPGPGTRPRFEPSVDLDDDHTRPAHLRFDGATSDLRLSQRIEGARTVFWVVWEDEFAAAAARPLLIDTQAPTTWLGGSGAPGSLWGSSASPAVRSGSTWLRGLAVTGTSALRPRTPAVLSVVTTAPVGLDGFGAIAGTAWHGALTELIVYDRVLTPEERAAVEAYLIDVHDLPVVGSVSGTLRARDGTVLANQPGVLTFRDATGAVVASGVSVGADGSYPLTRVTAGPATVQHRSGNSRAEVRFEAGSVGIDAVDALAARGALRVARARDLWEVTLPAGKSVALRANAVALGSTGPLSTRVIEVYDPQGSLVATASSVVNFTAPVAGRYPVVVRSSSATATGAYELSAALDDADHVYRLPSLPHATGTVRRADGQPMAGLVVRALRDELVHETVTDALGRYVAPLFEPGPVALEVLEAGRRTGLVFAEAPEEGSVEADVTLPVRGMVQVSVRRAGAPIANQAVVVESDHPQALPEDRTLGLVTTAQGLASGSLPVGNVIARTIDPRDGSEHAIGGFLDPAGVALELALPPGLRTISGLVRNHSQTPLPGAIVEARLGDAVVASTTAEPDGSYRLDAVQEGAVTIHARYRTRSGSANAALLGDATVNVSVPVGIVEGVVTDAAGSPLVGTVDYLAGGPDGAFVQAVATGADGRYRFEDVESGWVRAVLDDRQTPSLRAEVSGGTRVVDLVVAELEVTVIDGSGNPVEGAELGFAVTIDYGGELGEDSWTWDTASTGEDGVDGAWALIVSGASYAVAAELGGQQAIACSGGQFEEGRCRVEVHGDTSIVLAIGAASGIRGTVVDAEGEPVADAQVAAYGDESGATVVTSTDADGRFVFPGLAPEEHRVEARDPVNGRATRAFVTTVPEQWLDLTLRIPGADELGTVRLRAVDATTSEPLAGRVFTLTAEDLVLWSAEAVTDAAGVAVVESVPVDGLTLARTGEVPEAGATAVWLEAGQVREVTVPVGRHAAWPVDLTGADGQPLAAWPEEGLSANVADQACEAFCMGYADYGFGALEDLGLSDLGSVEVSADGREVRQPWQDVGPGLRASRRIFVPAAGRFGRVIDDLHNTSDQPLTVAFYGDQVSEAPEPWTVYGTGNGDLEFDTSDAFVTRLNADSSLPAVAFVLAGAPPALNPVRAGLDDEFGVYFSYEITLAPGQAVSLMRFVVPAADAATAQALAESLAALTEPEALSGLSPEERAAIVNFGAQP